MFGSEAIPAALFALLICFVPETPRYLVMIGKDERALNILSKINNAKSLCLGNLYGPYYSVIWAVLLTYMAHITFQIWAI